MTRKQRISYVQLDKMTSDMRKEMERCAKMGTPRPESSAVRAHVPGAFWAFANSWRDIFHTGVCDHAVKELARLYVSRAVTCEFCGNQRSIQAAPCSATSLRSKTAGFICGITSRAHSGRRSTGRSRRAGRR